tara:strand:- start:271 stop:639 length:369 start_codon:yes stop_codon:yes gene_type:complete
MKPTKPAPLLLKSSSAIEQERDTILRAASAAAYEVVYNRTLGGVPVLQKSSPVGFTAAVRDYYTKFRASVLYPARGAPHSAEWDYLDLPLDVIDDLDEIYMDVGGDIDEMMRRVAVRWGETR